MVMLATACLMTLLILHIVHKSLNLAGLISYRIDRPPHWAGLIRYEIDMREFIKRREDLIPYVNMTTDFCHIAVNKYICLEPGNRLFAL